MTAATAIEAVSTLVDTWCERRRLSALRHVLMAWPLHSGLSDEWHQLLHALEAVRAFAKRDLAEDEAAQLEDVIHEVQSILSRSR